MSDRKLLYEKITEISEKKNNLQEENENLKKQLEDYNQKLFDNFCEFTKLLIENVDFNQEDIDKVISERNEGTIEKKMAKHFASKIKELALTQNLNAKNIAYMVFERLKGI